MPDIQRPVIRTPDQRLRVFVSSTLQELAEGRAAARKAITSLRLAPVMFELGARPHPPRNLYRAYLEQSHIFIGIYWQHYGWTAPGMEISGLEDEYRLSGDKPKLIYIKTPALERELRLKELLDRIRDDDTASYKSFTTAAELEELIENDLAVLLTERFQTVHLAAVAPTETAKRRSDTLPTPVTSLIGREQELAIVCQLLRREDVRLLTLAGTAGTGKTRLGLQVATELRDDFEDGVVFVALAPIRDPALVVSMITRTLGIRESGGPTLLDSLKGTLRDRQIPLLLDNFEQVIAAAPVISDLLATASRLKVLVTSREVLHLLSEHQFIAPPLDLPDLEHLMATGANLLSALPQSSAVELFIQRATAAKPDFCLTRENASAVAQICIRLDGLPLAIELAAARTRMYPPQAMLARLESHLKWLTAGAHDLPARQQTLRNTIDWRL